MSDHVQKMINQLEARKTYLCDIEDLYQYVKNRLKHRIKRPKNDLVMERLLNTMDDFLDSVEKFKPFHKDFAPKRIFCFLNIVEQTVISVMISTGNLSKENFEIFGENAVNFLNFSDRERLLKFWRKQNSPKSIIRKVLNEWDESTIYRLLDCALKF